MRHHRRADDHENHDRWLVSYADFITLLFAFFVVMYAISSVNAGKYRVLSENLYSAFRSPISGGALPIGSEPQALSDPQDGRKPNLIAPDLRPLPTPPMRPDQRPVLDRNTGPDRQTPPLARPVPENAPHAEQPQPGAPPADASQQQLDAVAAALRNAMTDMLQSQQMEVRREKHWVELEIKDNLLFPSGSAQINNQAQDPLARIAGVLKNLPNRVQVEGYTDNVPIRNAVYPSNWELSAARAASVVEVLAHAGVDAQRMAAIGYGEHRPVADNASADGRLRNRRVVMVVLNQPDPRADVAVDPDAAGTNGPRATDTAGTAP